MKNLTTLGSALSDPPVPFTDQLRLAVAAYLARFICHRLSGAVRPGNPPCLKTQLR